MKKLESVTSGLAGSVALTLLHQVIKNKVSHAPRMDKLGMQALEKTMDKAGLYVPSKDKLYKNTLAGDLAANTSYYSLVGLTPGNSITTGVIIGALAGIGAIGLPGKMGLNQQYSGETTKTKILTIALYVSAGLIAGLVYKFMAKKKS